ncbi:MAG TPA: patatin-like phospholipase family protein [Dongiaceae bacterium]|nr:patatin-like phospholipase family protein [Dongiaceae bacterium]
MKRKRECWKTALLLTALVLCCLATAQAEDPCANTKRRALVLSGGGSKGAFEAGAVYHLVVQRHCDFHEFSGVSVGALNGAFLAQGAASDDPAESLNNLADQADGLVSLWQSVKSSKDIRKPRALATVRWGLFGLESLNDFGPLRQLLDRNISMDKLANGRPVRAGVVSFWTGGYREVVAEPFLTKAGSHSFLEFLYASSVPPVYGNLPRIPDGSSADNPKLWPQFTDGGLRHITPVASYFKICKTSNAGLPAETNANDCSSNSVFAAPPHTEIQQLFVIVTSPYPRDSDFLPSMDASCCKRGRRQITDGRKILGRTLALMDDAVYRSDLDFLQFANDMLRWRREAYEQISSQMDSATLLQAQRPLLMGSGFALESYNTDVRNPAAPSLPYEIGMVIPEKEAADPEHLLIITPKIIQDQLYTGCLAADAMMTRDFHLPSLADECAERFADGKPVPENVQQLNADANVRTEPTTSPSSGSSASH